MVRGEDVFQVHAIPRDQGGIEVLAKACEPGRIQQLGKSKVHPGASKSMKAQGHRGTKIHSVNIVCQHCNDDSSDQALPSLGYGFMNPDPSGPPYTEKETKQVVKFSFRTGPEKAMFWRRKRKAMAPELVGVQDHYEKGLIFLDVVARDLSKQCCKRNGKSNCEKTTSPNLNV